MMKKMLVFILGAVFILSCQSKGPKNGKDFGSEDTLANKDALMIDSGTMQNLIENISSPVEMAAMIKQLGTPYSEKYLATTKNLSNYNTANSKAFNLGIFSADMGYLNMYKKTSTVLTYISAIKDLADGINIGQFFDFTTLKRLATNNENLDSLMYIAVHSYNKMDNFLRKNNRSNLSVLMVTGVYIEGLYLTTQVYKERPNEKIAQNIGEQKNIFYQLLLILENYKKDEYFANLINELSALKKELEPVTINIIPGEPIAVEENGMLKIKQTSKSVVNISPETLKNIISQTEKIRNKLIL